MPRRILYIENGLGFGGATRCLHGLITGALQSGYEPFVAIAYHDPQVNALVDKLHRTDLSSFRRFGADSRPAHATSGIWAQTGARLTGSATGWVNAVIRDRPLRNYIQQLLRAWRIDLVHTNNGLLANRAEIQAAAREQVPLIAHQRGWEWPCSRSRSLVRIPARIVAISDAVREDLQKLEPPPRTVTRIHDGIDVRHYALRAGQRAIARAQYGIPDDRFVVGMIAAHLAWKGHELFFRALRSVSQTHDNLVALVVGTRPTDAEAMNPSPEQIARSLGLTQRLVFVPHVDDPADIYAACDVIAHTSTNPEPLGLVVLEAMAAGLPVVAPRAGGPAETVIDGETGLLFPMGDADALASALRTLISDTPRRQRLGSAACRRATECFDVRNCRRQILDLYEEVLPDRSRSAAPTIACPFEPSCS